MASSDAMSSANDTPIFEFLADDVVLMHPTGDPSRIDDVRSTLAERAKQGRFFMIADFNGVKKLHSEVGAKGNQVVDPNWIAGAVFVNASMSVRLGLKVYNLATILSGGNDFPVEYVKTLEEAMAAIARLRESVAKKAATG